MPSETAQEGQIVNMREHLARVMWCNTTDAPAEQWDHEENATREIYRQNVDALLAALRKPTEEMLAAHRLIPPRFSHKEMKAAAIRNWQAGIDEAAK